MKHRRPSSLKPHFCKVCGNWFQAERTHAKTCSARCRKRYQRGHRSLKTIKRAADRLQGGHLAGTEGTSKKR